MLTDFEPRLQAFAEVIVRIGLNLQRGQRLLIAEPYELQGVDREAGIIVEAVIRAADCAVEVIWGDARRLREHALNKDRSGFVQQVGANALRMQEYINNQDALLFLQGSQPRLLDGVPAAAVTELGRIAWEAYGPIAQQLVRGATNWTLAPAPIPAWAHAAYPDLPEERRYGALWQDVFAALRINESSPLAAWQIHLAMLLRRCADLNARQLPSLRYEGDGTDLVVMLSPEHTWRTAQLATRTGVHFVANLPTEEVFTAPHRESAEGRLRVPHAVNHGGAVIEGIELEFKRGRVTAASARKGAGVLQRLLDTDEGASRLGEVAIVPEHGFLARSNRLFYHPLLDENSHNHVALGEAYGFCLRRPDPAALNRSQVHLDLPLDASIILPGLEPG